MIAFIDESGTNKQDGHSTMAVVYVEVINKEIFEKEFSIILKELNIQEFHWADQGWKVRRKFIERVINLNFFFKVAVFTNPSNPGKMLEIVFQHLIVEENIHFIFIDGKKPRRYENELKRVLRSKGITVKKLRTVRSETGYFGVQLADALAGLIRYFEDNPKAEDAKDLILKVQRSKRIFAKYIFSGQ
ncbi:MAG: DUF3800 domain-containing protein [candidate division WWE3 bacterium]|nr:DUF3800 domain-containing protein [candidate division WWE3 bacterium]